MSQDAAEKDALESAEQLIAAGRASDVLEKLKAFIAVNGRNARARRLLGEALGVVGRYEDAVKELTESTYIKARDPRTWFLLARYAARIGRWPDVLRFCNSSTECADTNAPFYPELLRLRTQAHESFDFVEAALRSAWPGRRLRSVHDVLQQLTDAAEYRRYAASLSQNTERTSDRSDRVARAMFRAGIALDAMMPTLERDIEALCSSDYEAGLVADELIGIAREFRRLGDESHIKIVETLCRTHIRRRVALGLYTDAPEDSEEQLVALTTIANSLTTDLNTVTV